MNQDFQVKSVDEVKKMSVDEFVNYMTEWDKFTAEHRQSLPHDAKIPEFSSIEEAQKYYGGISFDEFEQKYFK